MKEERGRRRGQGAQENRKDGQGARLSPENCEDAQNARFSLGGCEGVPGMGDARADCEAAQGTRRAGERHGKGFVHQPASKRAGHVSGGEAHSMAKASPHMDRGGQRPCRKPSVCIEELRSIQTGFSLIYRHGRIMHNRVMKQFGLTGQQMGYLKYISHYPGISQEDLAKQLRIDKGAVAKSVRDMVEKGYVSREQNVQDKRAYCLYPAEKAKQVVRNGVKLGLAFEQKLTEGMTKEEVETFRRLLAKVTGNIEKMLEEEKEHL